MGFEPAPPKRSGPKPDALDHSATQSYLTSWIRTSDLGMTNAAYSPPLYQLSYGEALKSVVQYSLRRDLNP